VVELTQTRIAAEAEETSDGPGVVAVVDVERLSFGLGRAADGTPAALRRQHGLVVGDGDAVLALQVSATLIRTQLTTRPASLL
jgi:hypothetical protein